MNNIIFDEELKDCLSNRKASLEKLLKEFDQYKEYPPGRLRIVSKGSYFQFYWCKDSHDTNGKYITKDKIDLVKALAQKEYDKKIFNKAKKEYRLISNCLEFMKKNSLEEIYTGMHQIRKKLVSPRVPDRDKMVTKWKAEKYDSMGFTENTEFYTRSGIRVRSKSELIIADLLESNDIPYKYEKQLILKGCGNVRPDFTCLNKRTGKEIIWEHFGMMDNPEYAEKNIEKINNYQQNGIVIGKNMIASFETLGKPLSSRIIQGIINEYLL